MTRLNIPDELREKLAVVRAAQLERYHSDQVMCQHEAVILTLGLGPAMYLSLDGRVIVWHRWWMEDPPYDDPPYETSNVKEIAAGLVIGAQVNALPELLGLLPPRPADADCCPVCKGEHWLRIKTETTNAEIVCPECSGIGWTVNTK